MRAGYPGWQAGGGQQYHSLRTEPFTRAAVVSAARCRRRLAYLRVSRCGGGVPHRMLDFAR